MIINSKLAQKSADLWKFTYDLLKLLQKNQQ